MIDIAISKFGFIWAAPVKRWVLNKVWPDRLVFYGLAVGPWMLGATRLLPLDDPDEIEARDG